MTCGRHVGDNPVSYAERDSRILGERVGIRFGRRIRIAPGVRLNVGLTGASLSLGPRGATITMGRNGVFGNVGIPGSGLSYRTRLNGDSAPRSQQRSNFGSGATLPVSVHIAVNDQGTLTFTDPSGIPVAPDVERTARRQAEADIERLIQEACATANADIEALPRIHVLTPPPAPRPLLKSRDYDQEPPAAPEPIEPSFMDRMIPGRKEAIADQNRLRAQQHAVALQAHQDAYREFLAEERRRVKRYTDAGKPGAAAADIEGFFEQILQDLTWPRETLVELQASPDGRQLYVHVDLPEFEEFPDKEAVLARGGVKFKSRAAGAVRLTYAQHIHGIALRLMGEAFAWLPTVATVIFSGYSQRRDPATGHINDDYLISVRAGRADWQQLNFAELNHVDPVGALTRFDLRRTMTKSGIFTGVTPFPP